MRCVQRVGGAGEMGGLVAAMVGRRCVVVVNVWCVDFESVIEDLDVAEEKATSDLYPILLSGLQEISNSSTTRV